MVKATARHFRVRLVNGMNAPCAVWRYILALISLTLAPQRSGAKSRAAGPQAVGSVPAPNACQPRCVAAGISSPRSSRAMGVRLPRFMQLRVRKIKAQPLSDDGGKIRQLADGLGCGVVDAAREGSLQRAPKGPPNRSICSTCSNRQLTRSPEMPMYFFVNGYISI